MEIAPDPSEAVPLRGAVAGRLADAVGRLPLSLRTKLLLGFGLVSALLAVAVVLGLVALGQSNSRGAQLRRLQTRAVDEQVLLTDAGQLSAAADYRLSNSYLNQPAEWALDRYLGSVFNQLCFDAGISRLLNGSPCLSAVYNRTPSSLPIKLRSLAPSLAGEIWNKLPLFLELSGSVGLPQAPLESKFARADRWTHSFAARLAVLTASTRARANALVAANRRSYSRSRSLLLGVGAGSLALALVLVMLLSWSLVAPLRRTQARLAAIARGDFSGRLEVANRDEVGALAADVNRMSDELQRLYGELETASRHKSDFLATMSHELRTPLNAIIGFSELLHEQMFGELNERQLSYVEDVLEAGRHLLSLINDVLDLAKIEAGRMELELSEVALPDLLRSAVSLHAERARRSRIALGLTTEPEEITITADDRRVRQIVFNLLANAVKFTPADGRVDVSGRLDNGTVEVAVTDTGPGIPAEHRKTIFEEFEQVSDGKQAEGTGLGLPLSRKLVELHGGRLWVESEVGHGSTFRFTLPVRQETT